MELRRLFYSVLRKWWLIAILVVIGGGLSFLNVFLSVPVYQADTTMYILNKDKVLTTGQSLSTQDIQFSQQLLQNYSGIVFSRSVMSAAAGDLREYNLTENQIMSSIDLGSSKSSNILTLSAVSRDPVMAAAIANAVARAFTEQMVQLTNSDTIGILDEALVPQYPMSNNGIKKILIGILAGLIVALGIIYVKEYFDTTVRAAEDIEKGLQVRVIGIIPEHDIK